MKNGFGSVFNEVVFCCWHRDMRCLMHEQEVGWDVKVCVGLQDMADRSVST